MEESKGKRSERRQCHSIMTKNVTEFRHLIKNPHATENDITWAINLREHNKSSMHVSKDSMPPQVFHKKTKLSAIREQEFEKSKLSGHLPFKCSEYHHMVPKHNEKTLKHNSSAIAFFSSLRKSDKSLSNKENKQIGSKDFSTIPFKEKHQTPKLLKKSYMKKTQNITNEDLENATDGLHKYPQYTENILKTKNYAVLKTFTSVKGRGKVNLPGLAWQIGLRNY